MAGASNGDSAAAVPPRVARLRHAIVNRDWIAIAIELVVVTVGVLLAFEAQQFGERLSRQRDEREFLERVYRETGEGTYELQDLIRVHQRGVTELGAVLRAKHDPVQLAEFARREGFGCVIGTLPTAAYNDTASEELVASGRISSISDPELRGAVRKLAAEQAEGERQLAYARQVTSAMLEASLPYNRYELRNGEERTRCTIDWPRLIANPSSAAALARAYRIHQLMLEIRRDTLAATAVVRGKLA
ncbi:MAG: hypothetical protein ACJ8FN_09985 [Sphingomicrobium sp.]